MEGILGIVILYVRCESCKSWLKAGHHFKVISLEFWSFKWFEGDRSTRKQENNNNKTILQSFYALIAMVSKERQRHFVWQMVVKSDQLDKGCTIKVSEISSQILIQCIFLSISFKSESDNLVQQESDNISESES